MRGQWLILFRSVLVFTMALASTCLQAQWLSQRDPTTPRTPDGKPNLTAPAPRTFDGKPDLSGVWQAEATPLPEMRRIFGGMFKFLGDLSVPGMDLTEGTANKYLVNVFADLKPEEVPLRRDAPPVPPERAPCLPSGLPFANLVPAPHKFVQSPREIVILYEDDGSHRQIHTDGRQLPKEFDQPSWLGYSVGKWERDTLVVETAGFNDKTRFDILRHPHSEALRIVERYHRRDFGHMDTEMTLTDERTYTRPITIRYTEELLADTDVLESFCNENEKDSRHLGGAPANVRGPQ